MSFILRICVVLLVSIGLYRIVSYFLFLPGKNVRDLIRYPCLLYTSRCV